MRPPADGSLRRSFGVNLIALGCFGAGLWSLAVAAVPSAFLDRQVPLFPPILFMTRKIIGGRTRLVTSILDSGQERLATLAIGVVLVLFGVLLWRRIRYVHWIFLALSWIAPIYYLAAIYNLPVVHASIPRLVEQFTDSERTLVLAGTVMLIGSLLLVTGYLVWRRKEFYVPNPSWRKSPEEHK